MDTVTDPGALPVSAEKVTWNETGVPTVAGFGETAGLVSRPVEWPSAVATARASSISASGEATNSLVESRPRRRTVTPVIGRRMGRPGGGGNGTAVRVPRTLATPRPVRVRSAPSVRPVARHHNGPQPHLSDRIVRGLSRSAQRARGPFGRCRRTPAHIGLGGPQPITRPMPCGDLERMLPTGPGLPARIPRPLALCRKGPIVEARLKVTQALCDA